MDIKFLELLAELKNNYSDSLLATTIDCFIDETYILDLYQDKEKTRELLNGQRENFYNELVLDFIEDLNHAPEIYFAVWEPTLYFLSVGSPFLVRIKSRI